MSGLRPEGVASVPPAKLATLRGNIFDGAHAAIGDWHTFPWHRDNGGEVQADKPHSSQALAIDVFGAIGASSAKDANHSPRKSLAVLLMEELSLSPMLITKPNSSDTWGLDGPSDARLSAWMHANLQLAI